MRFTTSSPRHSSDRSRHWAAKYLIMYPYLFEIGPISVGTFGLMVALGFLSALRVLNSEFKRQGLHEDLGSTIVTTCMVGGIVGAKLYFVLFENSPETWDEVSRPAVFRLRPDLVRWIYRRRGRYAVANSPPQCAAGPRGRLDGHCPRRGLRGWADRLPTRR